MNCDRSQPGPESAGSLVVIEPGKLADKLRAAVPPSSSAIVLIGDATDIDDMLAALGENAEDVVRRTLTVDEEAALQASISAAPPTAP